MQLIIYEATYGRTLTVKWPHAAIWPPVPHPWYRLYESAKIARQKPNILEIPRTLNVVDFRFK